MSKAAQELGHAADLDGLAEHDPAGVGAQPGIGAVEGVEGEEGGAHSDGLLMVSAHILQEADVDRVGIDLRGAVPDEPSDGPPDCGSRDDEDDQAHRPLPPRPDEVVGWVRDIWTVAGLGGVAGWIVRLLLVRR